MEEAITDQIVKTTNQQFQVENEFDPPQDQQWIAQGQPLSNHKQDLDESIVDI